jgi:hypothetical protein
LRGFVPLHHVRSNFRFGEFADSAPEVLLFVGKREFHNMFISWRHGRSRNERER